MKCPHCSVSVLPDSVYCHRCGERLPEAVASPQPESNPSPAARLQAAAESTLEPEQSLWRGSYSAKDMVSAWLAVGLLTVLLPLAALIGQAPSPVWLGLAGALLLVWLGLLGLLAWRKLGVKYSLTTVRLIHERGVLTRYAQRLELIDIDDVSYRQGLVERLLGVGTIVIHSSDRTDPVLVMRGIDRVQSVASAIDDARRAERARRGLYVEAV